LLKELPVAEIRGVAQIVAVGAILAFMLRGPQWNFIAVLVGMMLAAASSVRNGRSEFRAPYAGMIRSAQERAWCSRS